MSESRQAGTVAMAQIAGAPRKLRKEEHERCGGRWGGGGGVSLGGCCPRPHPLTQTAKEPACHQGHTDGWLLGGWNTDLGAKVVLFAVPR